MMASQTLLLNPGNVTTLSDHSLLYSTTCTLLTNSSCSVESAQRQGIPSNLVGAIARGYLGNAIPIMVSPDIGNATRNVKSPVPIDSDFFQHSTTSSVL